MVRDLGANLAAGLRSLLFLRPRPGAWRPFPVQWLLLVLLDAAQTAAFAAWREGWEGRLDPDGVPLVLVPLVFALCTAWLMSQRGARAALLGPVATVLLVLLVLVRLGAALSYEMARAGFFPMEVLHALEEWRVVHAWWIVATVVAVLRIAAGPWRGRMADGAVALAVFLLPLQWMPEPYLWNVDPPAHAGAASVEPAGESVIYDQLRLMGEAVQRLSPQRPGVEDVYFVGLAGAASEDAFLTEASLAAEQVRTRFDADGRTLLLANNPGTYETLPLASATGLGFALSAVGETLDPDEDLVFVYLTGHGTADQELDLSAWPLPLEALTPALLRHQLDEAGIRWRVVVVSACHAGAFVEALRDEHTLVLTASDADGESPDCRPRGRLTGFGQAFLEEALARTRSLPAAFGLARESLARRAREQGHASANPLVALGPALAAKLERLARRPEKR